MAKASFLVVLLYYYTIGKAEYNGRYKNSACKFVMYGNMTDRIYIYMA